VLFLTTANSLASIPEALRDRMEIIRLPGYLEPEKLTIARRFLLPRQLSAHGIPPEQVTLDPHVLSALIRGWTREAGVRDLDRRIARLARKLARRALAPDATVVITKDELPSMLGPAPHDEQESGLRDQVAGRDRFARCLLGRLARGGGPRPARAAASERSNNASPYEHQKFIVCR
jgi:ATP-dependent Lon protease